MKAATAASAFMRSASPLRRPDAPAGGAGAAGHGSPSKGVATHGSTSSVGKASTTSSAHGATVAKSIKSAGDPRSKLGGGGGAGGGDADDGKPKIVYRADPDAVHRTGSLRDLFELCRRPGGKKSLEEFLSKSPFLARRPIRYGKRFSGGIGFQPCYYPGRYYYGSAGYPDFSPYPVHIVAANADDLGTTIPVGGGGWGVSTVHAPRLHCDTAAPFGG